MLTFEQWGGQGHWPLCSQKYTHNFWLSQNLSHPLAPMGDWFQDPHIYHNLPMLKSLL